MARVFLCFGLWVFWGYGHRVQSLLGSLEVWRRAPHLGVKAWPDYWLQWQDVTMLQTAASHWTIKAQRALWGRGECLAEKPFGKGRHSAMPFLIGMSNSKC